MAQACAGLDRAAAAKTQAFTRNHALAARLLCATRPGTLRTPRMVELSLAKQRLALLIQKVASRSKNERQNRDGIPARFLWSESASSVPGPNRWGSEHPSTTEGVCHVRGRLDDGERKSAEPMAASASPNPTRVNAEHKRLTYFTRSADWSDRDVRREAARYAGSAMTARQSMSA